MASEQEFWESMRSDLRKIDAVLSEMLAIFRSTKETFRCMEENLQCLEQLLGEPSCEEAAMEIGLATEDIDGDLPLGFGKPTMLESDVSAGDEEDSEICPHPMSANPSVLVTTNYRSPSRSRPSVKVLSNSNRKFQSAPSTNFISILNLRVTGREKEIKGGEAPSIPTVRVIVNEREPSVGINNNRGTDGLKSWGDSKGRIQKNYYSSVGSCLYISGFHNFWDPGGFSFGKISFQVGWCNVFDKISDPYLVIHMFSFLSILCQVLPLLIIFGAPFSLDFVLQLLNCLRVFGNQNIVVMQSGFENDPQEERGLIYENVELRLTNYACEVFDKTAHPCWMTPMAIDFLIDGVRFVWVVFDKMLDPYGVTQIAILIVGSESVGVACACSCSDYNDASLDFEICPLAMLNNDIQEMPSLALHFPKTSSIVILVGYVLGSNMKLFPHSYGYHLYLPSHSKLHPIFHVSFLKTKTGSGINPQPTLPRVGSEGVLPTCVMHYNARISKGQQVTDANKFKVISSISNKFRMEYGIKEKEIYFLTILASLADVYINVCINWYQETFSTCVHKIWDPGGFSSNWLFGPILLSGYQFFNLHNHSLTAPMFVQLGLHFFVSFFWRISVCGYLAKWVVSGSHSGAVSSFKLDCFFISQKGVFSLNALSYAELASRFPVVVMEHTYTNTPLSMRLQLSPNLRN